MRTHAVVVVAAFVLGGCSIEARDKVEDIKAGTAAALDAAAGAARAERDAYRRQLDARLEAVSAKIEAARTRAAKLQGEAKEAADGRIAKLEEQRARIAAEIVALEDKGGSALEAGKRGLDVALDDLESAYEDVREALD